MVFLVFQRNIFFVPREGEEEISFLCFLVRKGGLTIKIRTKRHGKNLDLVDAHVLQIWNLDNCREGVAVIQIDYTHFVLPIQSTVLKKGRKGSICVLLSVGK